MMIPVYFPFTYIQETIAQVLSGLLGPITLLQPTASSIPSEMKTLEKNILAIRFPDDQEDDRITALCNEYMTWRGMNRDVDLSVFKHFGRFQAEKKDASIFQLKTAIQKGPDLAVPSSMEATQPIVGTPFNTLLNARIFLQLAQNYDRQNLLVDDGLKQIQQKEKHLLESLKGDLNDMLSEGSSLTSDRFIDSGTYMPLERLTAWSRLFLECMPQATAQSPHILITDSRSIMDYLTDQYPNLTPMATLTGIAGEAPPAPTEALTDWRNRLQDFIHQLANGSPTPLPSGALDFPESYSAANYRLSIYQLADSSPVQFFSSFLDPKELSGIKNQPPEDSLQLRTILIIVERV